MNLERKIKNISYKYFPYTNVIGLARSVIAFGTLLTLVVNSSDLLIQKTVEGTLLNPLLNPISSLNKYNFFLLFGVDNFDLMRFIAILILTIVISGYYIKITSLLHWWISISFFFSSSIIDGGDQIASILTFLLLPLCLSDFRKNHWHTFVSIKSPRNLLGIFSIFLIRLQFAVIYFHAAVGKFEVLEWSNGTAIYYWLNHTFFGMPNYLVTTMNELLSSNLSVSILTYGISVFEIALFLAFTASVRYRKIIFPFSLLFHISIIYFLGIFSFFFSMTGGLILYLIPTYQPLKFKLWFQKK
jgi:antimicrobial peptide system SdpB family protein